MSLALRLTLFIGIWLGIALIATGFVLSALFAANARQNFRDLLQAHALNIIAVIDVDEAGRLQGEPDLGDPRFQQPLSGWYWAVSRADDPQTALLRSPNFTADTIAVSTDPIPPFDDRFSRSYRLEVPGVGAVRRLENQLYFGDGDDLYQVLVAGNIAGLGEAISRFNRRLAMAFAIIAVISTLASWFIVRLALQPLNRTTTALVALREGQSDTVEGPFPAEVAPLAKELNALLAANTSVIERARTQVGNLAHALKTPLAVLRNEADSSTDEKMKLVAQQVDAMSNQIATYLDRANIAAHRGVINARTEVTPLVSRLTKVMGKLFPDKVFEYDDGGAGILFRGEEQDLEEALGNLFENAARYAEKRVCVTIARDTTEDAQFMIMVEDDGPGMTDQEMNEATRRGKRFDELSAGSGLGLSIVRDIAIEYRGQLSLSRSSMGGLRAAVFLPSAASTRSQATDLSPKAC